MIALMLLFACKDEPKIDEEGCWLDGEEAFLALIELSCGSPRNCSPERVTQEMVDDCIDENKAYLPYDRENLCFDGCAVSRCLSLFETYQTECTDEALHETQWCYEETFYDGLEKACVTRPW